MHNILIITFDSEEKAYNGEQALRSLHEHSRITVYASTILALAADGSVDVLRQAGPGPLGTALTAVAGGAIGAIGGPVGAAAGAAAGAVRGAMLDHWNLQVLRDVVAAAAAELQPGEFLVLADVSEPTEQPVDQQLAELSCSLVRQSRLQAVATHIESELAAHQSRLKTAQLKAEQAAAGMREKLTDELETLQRRLGELCTKAGRQIREEASARVHVLEEQIRTAPEDLKHLLEEMKTAAEAEADRCLQRLNDQQPGNST